MKNMILIIIFSAANFIAWNYYGILIIVVIAILFVIIAINISRNLFKYILTLFVSFLFYNASASFWIFNVSIIEAISAIIINSILMLQVALASYFLFRYFKISTFSFVFMWLIFEYLTNIYFFAWNWVSLGNALGNQPYFAQWYSIFGVLGGSLWILLVGYLLFLITTNIISNKKLLYQVTILLFILPVIYSLSIYYIKPLHKGEPIIIAAINLRNSKPVTNSAKNRVLFNKVKHFDSLDYIVTPELSYNKISLSDILSGEQNAWYNQLIRKNKDLVIFFGAEIINCNKNRFNSIVVKFENKLLIRTKKKYVPFREFTPSFLSFLLGPSYYKKSRHDNNKEIMHKTGIFPVLCYESVFYNFVTKNSIFAEAIFVMTSEQFLNNSYFGKMQYLNIIRLRAIENNRNILKCSNGGISCVINEKGVVEKILNKEVEIITLNKIKENSIFQFLNAL